MDGNEKLYDLKKRSDEAGLVCSDPSKTVQSQAEDADINVIIARFGLTGQLPTDIRMPSSQDFQDLIWDYQTAQNILIEAQGQFMRLPADLRQRFDHDPQRFLEFCEDPANAGEMVRLGLRDAPAPTSSSSSPGSGDPAPASPPPAG